MDKVEHLRQLGSNETTYSYDNPTPDILETFENQFARNYTIRLECPEFTSLCPKTGQPDFCNLTITYIPHARCIETKSLKLYLFSYRNHGSFMETIVNTILNDLVSVCNPLWMSVNGDFYARGGITLKVTATYEAA